MSTKLRQVMRSFKSRPGFTAVVLLTFPLGIGATTALAGALPARRASRVDPLEVLRSE